MKLSFIKTSRLWASVSGTLVLASIILLAYPGLKFGIDFTGGTLIELSFAGDVSKESVDSGLKAFAAESGADIGAPYILKTSEGSFIIRIKEMTNEHHIALTESLTASLGEFTEKRFTTIGPTVGKTLKVRSIWALIIASISMVLYIAYAFRNIPRKLNPWKFGIAAMIALAHDIFVTLGIFVIIGQFTSFEVNTLFVTALLIIIGYSVNDTIVIFDRIRENVFLRERGEDFSVTAERGLQESITRSVNTVLTTLIPLFALVLFGGESIRWFVTALIVGIVLGAYSSIFLATPILVWWRKKGNF